MNREHVQLLSHMLAADGRCMAALQVLSWSAESPDDFYRDDRFIVGGGGQGFTYHAVWDPVTNKATDQLVANTKHDMFCPGITTLPNGDIIVTGGQNANRTSIYQLATSTWVSAPDMAISRGYGSSCLLSDGRVCPHSPSLSYMQLHGQQQMCRLVPSCVCWRSNAWCFAGVCAGWLVEWPS